ncbi:transcription initiation factor IIB [Candidatus Bathyarchaeota archaeon]|jgi:transcription initiation factor TFIIB|nr:transcription initiation factor IIB [Candidatus Bathyarchaeota archaeon]
MVLTYLDWKVSVINCPNCGSQKLIEDLEQGEEVCSRCGLVVKNELLDQGPEWRAFTYSEKMDKRRTGLGYSYTLYDKGLYTQFRADKDAKGKQLDNDTRIKMTRLKNFDNRSKMDENQKRNLSIAMSELDRMSVKLHIPNNVKERAAFFYRKALKLDLLRGRSIEGFVAASLYASCRYCSIPRPLQQITEVSPREHQEIARTYRLMLRELKIKMPVDDPFKFVPSIASKLNITHRTERYAIDILREADDHHGLVGKDPRGLAAAALYKACLENKERRIQKEIAEAAGTTEVTLRNRLKGIEKLINN